MPTFAILGDGAWGTAIALLLAQNPAHRVCLWSAREDNGRLLQQPAVVLAGAPQTDPVRGVLGQQQGNGRAPGAVPQDGKRRHEGPQEAGETVCRLRLSGTRVSV